MSEGPALPGDVIADLAGARRERDGAYRERAQLVAYLAACYGSVIMHDADLDAPGWSVIFIDTPSGQMSWHLHENDLDLFRHVPKILRHVPGPWDGHTADEKYRRLAELTTATAVARDVDNELRELLAEILTEFGNSSGDGYRARVGQVKYAAWQRRAGIDVP